MTKDHYLVQNKSNGYLGLSAKSEISLDSHNKLEILLCVLHHKLLVYGNHNFLELQAMCTGSYLKHLRLLHQ